MKNTIRLLIASLLVLGLFVPAIAQDLDLVKELSIYKDAEHFAANQRVEAIRNIKAHFTGESLNEIAKVLIKDACNTVISRTSDNPFVQRESLVSVGKMMGGGTVILKELLFEDPPFFTAYTTDTHKAGLIIDVMGELQLDEMRDTLHSYIHHIVHHPDLFPLNRDLENLLKTIVETLFFTNHVSTPQFFIQNYLTEENPVKNNLWAWLLMTFVKDQQIKHSRKRFLAIDDNSKIEWKAILRNEKLIPRDHDDFFIALHLLLLISSNMTIEEIMDYKAAYYIDYYTELSKRRMNYLDEAMDNINELYRIRLSPSGKKEENTNAAADMVKGFTQLALLFFGCFEDIDNSQEQLSPELESTRTENIRKYNEISAWIAVNIESVRFPKVKP